MADELSKEAENIFGDLFRSQGEILSGPARVIDADTLDVDGTRVRLFGIDEVEKNQMCQDTAGEDWPYGRHATDKLAAALDAQNVRCLVQDTDRYGRAVLVCEAGGKDINYWVVRNGWAVAYTLYSRDYDKLYVTAQPSPPCRIRGSCADSAGPGAAGPARRLRPAWSI